MKGQKTGGRTLGTRNKDRAHLFDEVEKKHPSFNVLVALLDLANKTDNDTLKFHCFKEYAKYVLPQLRSVVIEDIDPRDQIVHIVYDDEVLPKPIVIQNPHTNQNQK